LIRGRQLPYCFGLKSWFGNAAALSGTVMTTKGWSVVAWQALHPVVSFA
jgi:hypothetical protein